MGILFILFLTFVNAQYIISMINDVHLDLKYDPTVDVKSHCQTGMTKDNTLALYGRHGCDGPFTLFKSALEKMKAVNPSPNLILVPGDMVSHTIPRLDGRFDQYYYDELKVTIANFTATIASYFPDIPIIFTQGNDDYGINYQVPDAKNRADYYGFVYNKTIVEIKSNNISVYF